MTPVFRRIALAAALLLPLALPAGAATGRRNPRGAAPQPRVERARVLMGTMCTIAVEAVDETRAGEAVEAAFEEIARLDPVLSNWRTDSELSRLNASGFERRVPCSRALYDVLDSALALAAATSGAFDPTVEPLTRVWDLRGEGRVPEPLALAEARDQVGWRRLQLEPGTRTARFSAPGTALDLGGIGKGYALDRAAEVLRGRGVKRALLNFGGEILALSHREPWATKVADPAARTRPLIQIALSNGALSTSAQSERGFTGPGGTRYGHILDPRTGRPVATLASVSVVARSGTRADALSTALLVMGREAAAAWAASHPEIGVLWLEPGQDVTQAWAWNLPGLEPEPGTGVRWMTHP